MSIFTERTNMNYVAYVVVIQLMGDIDLDMFPMYRSFNT